MENGMFLLKFSVFLWLLICFNSSVSQSWKWQNPLPQGNDLNDVQFLNNSIGFAVGNGSTILRTTNGGTQWTIVRAAPANINFIKIQMLDQQTGWLIAKQTEDSAFGAVYRTSDGWHSWQTVFEDTVTFYSLFWLDENIGWVGTENGLYATDNGGQGWSRQLDGNPIQAIFFLDSNRGWVCSGNRVYRTSDAGQNWQSNQIWLYSVSNVPKVQFLNSQTGWLITQEWGPNYYGGGVFKSSDGGVTWTEQYHVGGSFGPYVAFSGLKMLNLQTGFACDDAGTIHKTTDGGSSWTAVDTLGFARVIDFTDTNTGWCAGKYGVLYHTDNSSLNWHPQYTGNVFRSVDLYFLNEQIGFAAGEKEIIKTADGGNTWQYFPVNPFPGEWGRSRAICFINNQKGWISWEKIGAWGSLLYTEDGGQNFIVQLDSISRLLDIFFLNETCGWAVGSGNVLYYTTNGGQTWLENILPVFQGEFHSIIFVDSLNGWIGGYHALLHSVDGGQTWVEQNPGIPSYIIYDVKFSNSQFGIAAGKTSSTAYLFRTCDGGENWQTVLNVSNSDLKNITIIDSLLIFAAGESHYPRRSLFYYSIDGGNTWQLDADFPLASGIIKIAYPDEGTRIWFLGYGGSIGNLDLSNFPGIKPPPVNTSDRFILYQNYPNPFNSETTIEFYLPRVSLVRLDIFDLLGQKVRALVNRSFSTGLKEVKWNGRDDAGQPVASGVYVYRLKAGNRFVQSRKMLLLR